MAANPFASGAFRLKAPRYALARARSPRSLKLPNRCPKLSSKADYKGYSIKKGKEKSKRQPDDLGRTLAKWNGGGGNQVAGTGETAPSPQTGGREKRLIKDNLPPGRVRDS